MLKEAELSVMTLDSASRALALFRIAGGWFAIDPSHAIQVYKEAFTAARDCDPAIRKYVENDILNDLLPLSPSDVLDILPSAEPETQEQLFGALINFALSQGDYRLAARAFDSAVTTGILPQRATIHLLASLPQGETERTRVFSAAAEYYRVHPDPESFHWGFAALIAHFYEQLPSQVVLRAIGTVLAEGEQQEKERPGGSSGVQFGAKSLTSHSPFEFQLFAVAPAMRHLDPGQVRRLLRQHPEVKANLKRFPRGLASFDTQDFTPEREIVRVDHRKPEGLQLYNTVDERQNLSPLDMGLEFTIPRNVHLLGVNGSTLFYANPGSPEASALNEGNTCPKDLVRRLAMARAVPVLRKEPFSCGGPLGHMWCSYIDTFPRAALIQVMAERCTYYDDPGGARRALHEQLELVDQIPEEHRIEFLAVAADLYLRLGDRQAAADVVHRGLVAARAVYQQNLGSQTLEKVSKGIWPAAEAYRRMIALGVSADLEATRKAIDEIPDPGFAQLERTMLARSLLGVPVRRYMEMKASGSFCTIETEATYDQI
jgi:hypothetical protein